MEKIHYYNIESGEYIFSVDKQSRVSYPSNTAEVELIPEKDGYARVLKDGSWDYVKDLRGQKEYNTDTREEREIDYIGEVKDGWTLKKPNGDVVFENDEWVERVKSKEEIIAEIDLKTQEDINKGFIFDNHPFSLSREAQINWLMLEVKDKDLVISTMDSKDYLLASKKIKEFKNKFRQQIRDCLSKGRQEKKSKGL